ncbi:conserved hypothetical protein (plasmid) [Acaryochloris marina MBIC11017]|uniref:Transposase n=1 Tax=Acaryochloris marina (strain MBIC 11017) TaxID=329726 RepID=A8ZMI0_ACAM1|nr:conserved hypothetical protein [Acaryochloris marina MBIC11017]
MVLEVVSGQRTPTETCRAHKIHMSVLSRWRNEFLKQAYRAFGTQEVNDKASERIAELERMIGRLTMELEVAKKASDMWNLNENMKW